MRYEYYINLNEREYFFADVRDPESQTIFEIHGFDIFEDGYMSHEYDLDGLRELLVSHGYINENDNLVRGN